MSQYWDSYWKRTLSRRRMLAGGSVAVAGVAGMALAGCGDDDDDDNGSSNGNSNLTPISPTQNTSEQPVKGGTFRFLTNVGSILDPHRTNTPAESLQVWGAIGNTLVRFSTKNVGSIEGDLASALPEVPADGLTLTFKIRPEAKWQQRAPYLREHFKWTKDRIVCKARPETWWMSARTWNRTTDRTQQGNTLAGLHADHILFILDESGGIPDAVMATAEAALSSCVEGHIVQAGNPTHLDGPLYRACTSERRLWHVTEITADPDDRRRSSREQETAGRPVF